MLVKEKIQIQKYGGNKFLTSDELLVTMALNMWPYNKRVKRKENRDTIDYQKVFKGGYLSSKK